MLNVLLESKARRQRRTAGAVMSVGAHVTLIVGAIVLTARGGETAGADPVDPAPIYVPTPAPVSEATTTTAATPRVDPGVRGPQRVTFAPVAIPLGTAQIGPGITTDPVSFDAGSISAAVGNAAPLPGSAGPGVYHGEQVERSTASLPGNPLPAYPEALRVAGLRGEVLMQFVVDTAGRVEAGSVRILASSHPLYDAAVRAVLPRYRFTPATVGGAKVRQLVQMPFAFEPARRR